LKDVNAFESVLIHSATKLVNKFALNRVLGNWFWICNRISL